MMTTKQILAMALGYRGMKMAELARELGWSKQLLHSRVKTGKFSAEEWEAFGEAMGATTQITFTFPDGKAIGLKKQ